MEWPLLAGAILSEVTATISLKLSDGVRRPVPGVIVAVGNGCAFSLSRQVLGAGGLAIGVTYGICAPSAGSG